MTKGILIGLMMAVFATSGAWAEGDQQNRMKTCNADAKKQSLAGDARKAFMKTCLSNPDTKPVVVEAATPATTATVAPPAKEVPAKEVNKEDKPLTKQQQRMKDCNAEAKAKELKGDPRKAFMKTCLSNKK